MHDEHMRYMIYNHNDKWQWKFNHIICEALNEQQITYLMEGKFTQHAISISNKLNVI